jgi:hypothetical protein
MRIQFRKIKNLELSKSFFSWGQYLRKEKPEGGWGESLLFGTRKNFWLFDINFALLKLRKTFSFIYTVFRKRGRILFINAPEDFEEYWEKLVSLSGHVYYSPKNWLFGGLTNKTFKFYQGFSLIVLYNTDLGIVSESLKMRIPIVYFGDISQHPKNIDYPLGFLFKTKEQVFWYFQIWRNLFKKAQMARPYLKDYRFLGYRKFKLQLATRKIRKNFKNMPKHSKLDKNSIKWNLIKFKPRVSRMDLRNFKRK